MTAPPSLPTLLICRPGLEQACRDETAHAAPASASAVVAPGLIRVIGPAPAPEGLIFERQRLPDAQAVPLADLHPVAPALVDTALTRLDALPGLWTLHVIQRGESPLRPDGVGRALAREIGKRDPVARRRLIAPDKAAGKKRVAVIQVLLCSSRAWLSVASADRLASPYPEGIRRIPFDPRAPSRSYLKLEEAFQEMGAAPTTGDRVVDLGAAPGGWSYACLKRGARVTAVDNGPLHVADFAEAGMRLRHIRANGLTWRPPHPPVDWLVADLLIPPGPAFGLLKTWMDEPRCRNLVFNIKLPQQEVWPALTPILDWLSSRTSWTAKVKHLYHDRREVTVLGTKDMQRCPRRKSPRLRA